MSQGKRWNAMMDKIVSIMIMMMAAKKIIEESALSSNKQKN